MPEGGEHLSSDQISSLLEETESPNAGRAASHYVAAQEHLATCESCASRVAAQQRVAQALRNLEVKVGSKRTASCPDDRRWLDVVGGLVSSDESSSLLNHAATCPHCGPLLRQAAEDIGTPLSPAEETAIAKLPSAGSEWQTAMSWRMEREGLPGEPKDQPSSPGWLYRFWSRVTAAGGLRFAFAAAAVLVIAAASVWWITRIPRLSTANQLIAKAYLEQRTVVLRLPELPNLPVQQTRTETGGHALPSKALLDAELLTRRGLKSNGGAPQWLQANGLVALIGGDNQVAIQRLESARKAEPSNTSLMIDLAAAYFQESNLIAARQLLNEALALDPGNQVALYDLAFVLQQQGKYGEAVEAWKHYLELDKDPASSWAREAEQQQAAAAQVKQSTHLPSAPLPPK